jgi:hypothetical protein
MYQLPRIKMRLFGIGLTVLAGACTSIGRNVLVEDLAPRDSKCPLHFYRAPADVPVPYTAVCGLNSRVLNLPWDEAQSGEALANAREMVCACGADAVLLGNWAKHALFLQGNLRIVAIKYQNPGAPEIGKPMTFEAILDEYQCDDRGGTWHEAKCKLPENKDAAYRRDAR